MHKHCCDADLMSWSNLLLSSGSNTVQYNVNIWPDKILPQAARSWNFNLGHYSYVSCIATALFSKLFVHLLYLLVHCLCRVVYDNIQSYAISITVYQQKPDGAWRAWATTVAIYIHTYMELLSIPWNIRLIIDLRFRKCLSRIHN